PFSNALVLPQGESRLKMVAHEPGEPPHERSGGRTWQYRARITIVEFPARLGEQVATTRPSCNTQIKRSRKRIRMVATSVFSNPGMKCEYLAFLFRPQRCKIDHPELFEIRLCRPLLRSHDNARII